MSSPSFRHLFFEQPELLVEESETSRCVACSGITYEKFRAGNPLAEFASPKTVVIGSYSYVAKSAFGGCWVCRIILRQISQTATSLQATLQLYSIATIGLRLSLDDELSLHCYDEGGYDFVLNDLSVDVIDLRDGEWSEEEGKWTSELYGKELEWTFDRNVFPPLLAEYDSNRLILNPDVDNGRLLSIHWLSNCCKTHKACAEVSELPELPTRVLDIGRVGESHSSQLILTSGLRAEYVTLSHCWGKTHHTMSLTRDSLETMMTGVEDSKMPKTFQEAIMVCRGLGQRYLWIDAMCIIQPTDDDNSDWEKEGAKMGDTYRNSTLTIAASSAYDNTEGCLFGKAASQFDVHPVPLFEESLHRNWDEFSTSMNRNPEWFPMMHPKPASWLNHVQNSPLNSRAWVLQERVLSPRILHCTMQGFFWECSELRASEYEPLGSSFDYFYRDQGLLNVRKLLMNDKETILGNCWRKIVERYCQLGLSVPSDRLPALAGLARVIQDHTKDQYIAGHWKSSLVSSLLWFRLDKETKEGRLERDYAPSWSWASTLSEVKFTSLERHDYPTRDLKDYIFTAKLLDFTGKPAGSNPLFWKSQSKLTLRGRLRDDNSVGGLPTFEPQSRTPEALWRGYKPVSSDIGQLGAIEIKKRRQFVPGASETLGPESRSSGNSVIATDGVNGEAGSSTTGGKGEVEELGIGMASIALDHEKLQASTKEYMEMVTSSRQWKDLEEESRVKGNRGSTQNDEELIQVTYDDPVADVKSEKESALLEILRSSDEASTKGFCEGLVLRQVECEDLYVRVGYFWSGNARLFGKVLDVEVALA